MNIKKLLTTAAIALFFPLPAIAEIDIPEDHKAALIAATCVLTVEKGYSPDYVTRAIAADLVKYQDTFSPSSPEIRAIERRERELFAEAIVDGSLPNCSRILEILKQ